ncbi:hypothetical protein HK096_006012, partial [Nowakowskiella sp. JEL0078]
MTKNNLRVTSKIIRLNSLNKPQITFSTIKSVIKRKVLNDESEEESQDNEDEESQDNEELQDNEDEELQDNEDEDNEDEIDVPSTTNGYINSRAKERVQEISQAEKEKMINHLLPVIFTDDENNQHDVDNQIGNMEEIEPLKNNQQGVESRQNDGFDVDDGEFDDVSLESQQMNDADDLNVEKFMENLSKWSPEALQS